MSPRLAGWLAIIGALALAVVGGVLVATPPWSIPGAIVLVGASILFSVETVWLLRRTWSEPWPPYTAPSVQKQLRRLGVLQIINSVLFVAIAATAAFAIANQNWWQLLYAVLLVAVGTSNFNLYRLRLRYLRQVQSSEIASEPEK